MLLRFLGLFLPLKRVVWVKTTSGHVLLRKLHRNFNEEVGVTYYEARPKARVGDIIPYLRILEAYSDHGMIHKGGAFEDWGEWRPWWNPLPPIPEDPCLIEINKRAKKEEDGRFRKTRTLPQVWEQG